MLNPTLAEFRRDVLAVARQGDQAMAQVARGFGISESCLIRWSRIADREDCLPGPASFAALAADGSSWPLSRHSRARRTSATGPLGGDAARGAAPKKHLYASVCGRERDV